MIVVKVELWPHGDKGGMEELGRVVIANDLTGNEHLGHYIVTCYLPAQPPLTRRVREHTRSKGWVPLVDRAIGELQRADHGQRVRASRPFPSHDANEEP